MKQFWQRSSGSAIFFVIATTLVLVGLGVAFLKMGMIFGGSGELSGAVDAAALNVGKKALNHDVVLGKGDAEEFSVFADKNSDAISLIEINEVLAKAMLTQMNETAMEKQGFSSQLSKQHADSLFKEAMIVSDKLADKLSDFKNHSNYFNEMANSNSLAMLGAKAKVEVDSKGWSASFVDRGEESNVQFEEGQLPEGFKAEDIGVKAGDGKYYIKGYTPLKIGDKTMHFVPFKLNGQPHLVSGKTFNANSLSKLPMKGWEKPIPNAISVQGKTVLENNQVLEARSYVQINPSQTFKLEAKDCVVRILIDNNVAHWIVNGAAPSPVSVMKELSSALGKLGQISKTLGSLSSIMSGINEQIRNMPQPNQGTASGAAGSPNADPNGTPNGTPNGSPNGAPDGAPGGSPGGESAPAVGGGGVASIGGSLPPSTIAAINKQILDNSKGLKEASSLLGDGGAAIITDNGAGIVTDNGAGLLSERGTGLISDRGHGIVTDNGAGLTGGRRGLMSVDGGAKSGNSLSGLANILSSQQALVKSLSDGILKAEQSPEAQKVYGPESNYGYKAEKQERSFPMGMGSLNVVAFLGNEYPKLTLYDALFALDGDYKEVKKVICQRLRQLKGDFKDEELDKALKAFELVGDTAGTLHNYMICLDSDKNVKVFVMSGARAWAADGSEREIAKDSKEEKPNYCVVTPQGIGAKALPSHCTTRGTFYWKPGTGYNKCLGELRLKRETDIHVNGTTSLF